jgi:hypothetical protein
MTTSGKLGRFTVPPDTSAARLRRKARAAARSSGAGIPPVPATAEFADLGVDVAAAFGIVLLYCNMLNILERSAVGIRFRLGENPAISRGT